MKVQAVKCPKCGEGIYSRARHDWHTCGCGSIFVDGGFDYCRIGAMKDGVDLDKIKSYQIEVRATKQELYDDWSTGKDRYGRGRVIKALGGKKK